MAPMQLQFKPEKAEEIMYQPAKEQQTKYHLIYLRALDVRRKPQSVF